METKFWAAALGALIVMMGCAASETDEGGGAGGSAGRGGSGGSEPAGGSGGGGEAGGGAGGGGGTGPARCLSDRCICAPDCCTPSAAQQPSRYDETARVWECPDGLVDIAGCGQEDCACDLAARPYCLESCCDRNNDRLYDGVCVDGAWACPPNAPVSALECQSVECPCENYLWAPGDRCDAEGEIYCDLTPGVLGDVCDSSAPITACQNCRGFDPAVVPDGCTCACNEVELVVCSAAAP